MTNKKRTNNNLKILFSALIPALIALSLAIVSSIYVHVTSTKMMGICNSMVDSYKDAEEFDFHFDSFKTYWNKTKPIWRGLIDHSFEDDIDISVIEIAHSVSIGDEEETLLHTLLLKSTLKLADDNDLPLIGNIF